MSATEFEGITTHVAERIDARRKAAEDRITQLEALIRDVAIPALEDANPRGGVTMALNKLREAIK